MKINPNLKFELKARAFENMRFMLAPGKDQRSGPPMATREKEWYEWCDKHDKVFGHFIRAAEELM
jgi:hypothetical protein